MRLFTLSPLFLLGLAAACTSTGEEPPPPAPPVVTVPAATYVAAGATFAITAEATDPNGDALTYRWEQLTGSPLTVSGATTETLTVTTPSIRGDLAFRVTVTDSTGASDSAEVTLWVRANTLDTPLGLRAGRSFTYAVREQVYGWVRDSAYLDPDAPVDVGTVTLTFGQPQLVNGINVWPFAMADNTQAQGGMAGMACMAGTDDTACGSPNLGCVMDSCTGNKPLVSTGNAIQVDGQLFLWTNANTEAVLVVNPSRTVGLPYLHDGHDFITGRTRVAPLTPPAGPIRFLGATDMNMPAAPTDFAYDTNAPCVEVFDGTRNPGVLSPYSLTRTFYQPLVGITYFQWESVGRGFDAAGQVGYRDALLTAVTDAP